MQVLQELGVRDWKKVACVLFVLFIALFLSWNISSRLYIILLLLFFTAGILVLYSRYFELFILFVLVANDEFLYLLPRLGGEDRDIQYQASLFLVLMITGGMYLIRENREQKLVFGKFVIVFVLLVLLAILNAYIQGQPFYYGSRSARPFFLILFYFVFMAKKINIEKLFGLLVLTGVFVTFANNLQYLFFERFEFFYFTRDAIRADQLRFMQAIYFVIVASLIAFGEYLRTKKRRFLFAFIYMMATVVIQGQTRIHIGGYIITILILLVLAKKLDFTKAVLVVTLLFAFVIVLVPVIQRTFFGELFEMTRYDLSSRAGSVEQRFDTFDYFFGEAMKSPVIGRGIWDAGFRGNNPEDMSSEYMFLTDIGITSIFFHFGLLGLVWFFMLLSKVYKLSFSSVRKLRENIHFGLIGFFIFNLSIIITVNKFTQTRAIIYFVLVLALLNQLSSSSQKSEAI